VPNLLARQFHAPAPNRIWAGDITFIPTRQGWLYLAVVLDLYARRVVGWAMSARPDSQLVLDALTMALTHRRPAPAVAQPPPVVQAPPIVVVQMPPPTPMHAVERTNWGLAGGGIAMLLSGYVLSAFMGAAIIDASGDPGTPRWWPFVPFVGATIFTATYREAANCECSTGRVFSVLGAVAIDALQVGGLAMMIVGLASTKTRMVPDTVGVRLRPDGVLEGKF
jgi:hypothetical protein